MDHAGHDRKYHELATSKKFASLYKEHKSTEKIFDEVKVPSAKQAHEEVWPVVDVISVKKSSLFGKTLKDMDVPYEFASDLVTKHASVAPPSELGFNRIKLDPNGKIMFSLWPHGYVCASVVTGLRICFFKFYEYCLNSKRFWIFFFVFVRFAVS